MTQRSISLMAACLLAASVHAQSMNVRMGSVVHSYSATEVGDMVFEQGNKLRIGGSVYDLKDVQSLEVSPENLPAGTVHVRYNGAQAEVYVAGDVAGAVRVQVNGAHVAVLGQPEAKQTLRFLLEGSAPDGSFYMDGDEQAEFVFNGLTLHCMDSAAVNIEDGKKLTVQLNGTNSLSDGAQGSQKACFYANGHVVLTGTGCMELQGNARHAYFSDEYTVLDGPALTVRHAVADGMHVNQYLHVLRGSIDITGMGDGIDVGRTKDSTDTQNGMLLVDGGTIRIVSSGQTAKGIKTDGDMLLRDGVLQVAVAGDAYYDAAAADISSAAALKPGGLLSVSGGRIDLKATGSGGKGVNADGAVTISGGVMQVVTTGSVFVHGTEDAKPQGVKSDADITVSGGEVYVFASPDEGKAFSTDYRFEVNGGKLLGVGNKKSEPTGGSQAYRSYTGQIIRAGSAISYDGVSCTVPAEYNMASGRVMVSAPGL